MLCPSRSTWVRFATPTKDIGTDPDRFPLLFQSDYTLRHWPRRHLAYWRIISSFVPSQMALCCAQRGRCSAPDGHPPDSGSGRATSPAGSGLLCLRRISALLCRSSHLPINRKGESSCQTHQLFFLLLQHKISFLTPPLLQ